MITRKELEELGITVNRVREYLTKPVLDLDNFPQEYIK